MSIKIESNINNRLVVQLRNLEPSSRRFTQAMIFIGTEIRNRAIDNLTESGAVDSGGLRSSIRFDIKKTRSVSVLNVGAFGQPHARIVEFGGPFTPRMRAAMFARFNDEGRPKRPGKGIIRANYYTARPYMEPAIESAQKLIKKTIQQLVVS